MGLKAVVCDVNETLFALEAFRPRLAAAGLTQDNSLELWFATVLRDGIALSAAGGFATFRDIASNAVKQMTAKSGSSQNPDEAAASVIQGFDEVQAHPDVLPGLRAIHNAGIQVCTMTNGSKGVTQAFLDRSGLKFVSPVLDVEGPRCWKPCKRAYQYVCSELGLQPSEEERDPVMVMQLDIFGESGAPDSQVMLVAVHPWDCNGAQAAGLQAAFIARHGEQYPGFFQAPDYQAASLEDLAKQLKG